MDATPHRDADALAEWLDALAGSEARVACRQTVPLELVLDRIRARIPRMKENPRQRERKIARDARSASVRRPKPALAIDRSAIDGMPRFPEGPAVRRQKIDADSVHSARTACLRCHPTRGHP
jgi:hypothetical protein